MRLSPISTTLLLAVLAMPALAVQPRAAGAEQSSDETRESMQAAADEAEALAARTKDKDEAARLRDKARLLRERLRTGDLRVGDGVIIEFVNPVALRAAPETLFVREGQMLQLRGTSREVPLAGLLRFEAEQRVTEALMREYQNAEVRVNTMLILFLTGEVNAPGSRGVTPDALLSDVVTTAGTLTSTADIEKITIKRKGLVLYDGADSRDALTVGRTVEDLQLTGGDEIIVGRKRQTSFFGIIQAATGMIGLVLGIYGLSR